MFGMSYTATDLDEITAAIVALVKGEQVVNVRLAGGKGIEYGAADLDDLRSLKNEVAAEIAAASGTDDTIAYIQTSKGY